MTRLQVTVAGLLMAAALPAPVGAEIYRWTDESGRVHYGDRRAGPAALAEARPDLADESEPTSRPAIEPPSAVRDRVRARLAALEQAQLGVVEARKALERALAQRGRGIEPLPGERLGMAGGGSRLAPEYFERQARLEEAVQRARAQLDAAQAAKNELR